MDTVVDRNTLCNRSGKLLDRRRDLSRFPLIYALGCGLMLRATGPVRVAAGRLPRIATQNLTVLSRTLRQVAAVSRVVASSFDTRASAHPPSLARGRERYRHWRWRPNGSRRGTAITFALVRAIPPRGADAWDQFLPRALRGEKTKSFGEGERARWSSSAGSDSPHDRAVGGRGLRAGSLGPPLGEQATKQ